MGNMARTDLEEVLHAVAQGGIGLLLCGEGGELLLGDLVWIGGNVRGGHSGDECGDATMLPRPADLVS